MCQARQVLVIEDVPVVRQLLSLMLTDEGYDVHLASNGVEALTKLESIAPCLILLDLRMPVMDGATFARAYRARKGADAHLLVVTAEARANELDAIAPVQVVPKPFDLEHLVSVVNRWVRAHRPPTGAALTQA